LLAPLPLHHDGQAVDNDVQEAANAQAKDACRDDKQPGIRLENLSDDV